jgi:hypothetical protein
MLGNRLHVPKTARRDPENGLLCIDAGVLLKLHKFRTIEQEEALCGSPLVWSYSKAELKFYCSMERSPSHGQGVS